VNAFVWKKLFCFVAFPERTHEVMLKGKNKNSGHVLEVNLTEYLPYKKFSGHLI
jgi:hypothetical protein